MTLGWLLKKWRTQLPLKIEPVSSTRSDVFVETSTLERLGRVWLTNSCKEHKAGSKLNKFGRSAVACGACMAGRTHHQVGQHWHPSCSQDMKERLVKKAISLLQASSTRLQTEQKWRKRIVFIAAQNNQDSQPVLLPDCTSPLEMGRMSGAYPNAVSAITPPSEVWQQAPTTRRHLKQEQLTSPKPMNRQTIEELCIMHWREARATCRLLCCACNMEIRFNLCFCMCGFKHFMHTLCTITT